MNCLWCHRVAGAAKAVGRVVSMADVYLERGQTVSIMALAATRVVLALYWLSDQASGVTCKQVDLRC